MDPERLAAYTSEGPPSFVALGIAAAQKTNMGTTSDPHRLCAPQSQHRSHASPLYSNQR